MPSVKAAKNPEKLKVDEPLIEITAVRKFAVDYAKEELKKMQADDKDNRSMEGMTKMIEVGGSARVTKEVAKKLQDCGAAKVTL